MKLRLTRRATQQVEAILGRPGDLSPKGRASVANRVSEVALLLSEHPFVGRQTSRARVRQVAPVPFPHVVDCRVDGDAVVLLGIRHTSRKPTS